MPAAPSLHPLAHRIARLTGRACALADAADRIVVLSPAETAHRPPALHLPGQAERVIAVQPDTTPDHERARIAGGPVEHAATLAFRLRGVRLLGGTLFGRGTRVQLTGDRPPRLAALTRERVAGPVAIAGSVVGDMYFGHRAVDDAATLEMAAGFGQPCLPQSPREAGWPHAAAYRAALGMAPRTLGNAVLDEAWLFQDHGMTAHRRARLTAMRARLAGAGAGPRPGGGRVLILRGGSGAQRVLSNEDRIAARLAAEGWSVVDPARDDLPRLRAAMGGAAIVAGVEGSALAHAILLGAPDMTLIAIQPPRRFNNLWKDFTDLLGMRYGFVVARPEGADFAADPEEILRTADLARPISPSA